MAEVLKDVNHIHPLENFVEDGIDMLPSGFLSDKINFMRLLTLYLTRLQTIDNMLVYLAENRTLLKATGLNLDEIGQQLGIFRNGLEDTDYRAVILILTGASATSGTRPELIASLTQLFGEGNFDTWKGENFRFDINIFDSCFDVISVIDEILDMLPLITFIRITESDGLPFGFADDKNSVGFGSAFDEMKTGIGGWATELYNPPYTT